MYTNYNNIYHHPYEENGHTPIDTVVYNYRTDITDLKIENNTLRISACKTGFMTDELMPRRVYNGSPVPAINIYKDPDKRTHRQRAEDLLTYSELRKLATTTINSAEEDIDEFIEILQKLKANKVFRSCKRNNDIKLEKEHSEHKDREDIVPHIGEDYMKQTPHEYLVYASFPTNPLPPVTDDSSNVPISPVTDDSSTNLF